MRPSSHAGMPATLRFACTACPPAAQLTCRQCHHCQDDHSQDEIKHRHHEAQK